MSLKKNKTGGMVYSSEFGKICPGCGKPVSECTCRNQKNDSKEDGVVRIRRETSGRHGKSVTVITGIPLDYSGLSDLGKKLKQKLGTGGTVKNGIIEIQGDHTEFIMKELKDYGWTVKKSGG